MFNTGCISLGSIPVERLQPAKTPPEPHSEIPIPEEDFSVALLSFSKGGRYLAARHPGGLSVWEVKTGNRLVASARRASPYFSPDGSRLVVLTGRRVEIFDIRDLEHPYQSVAINPDWNDSALTDIVLTAAGDKMAVAAYRQQRHRPGVNTRVILFDISSGNSSILWSEDESIVSHLGLLSDGLALWRREAQELVTINFEGQVLARLQLGSGFFGLSPYDVAVSRDGRWAAIVLTDCTLRVWDLKTERLHGSFSFPFKSMPGRAAFTPSGGHLLALVSGRLAIWRTSDWALIRLFRGSFRERAGIAISPEEEWLAVQVDDPAEKRMRSVDGDVFYIDKRIPYVRIYELQDLLTAETSE